MKIQLQQWSIIVNKVSCDYCILLIDQVLGTDDDLGLVIHWMHLND